MLEKILRFSLYLLLALLPFQTRYLLIESANPFTTISIYGFDCLLIVIGLLWLWHWYHQPGLKPNWTSLTLGISLLIVAVGSSYFATDKTVALFYWLHLALGIWLVAMIATTKLNHQIILGIAIGTGCIQAIAATIQFLTQHVIANKWLGMAVQLPELSGVSVVVTTTGRWLRSYALLPHPNIAGGLMVLALVAAAYLSRRYWWLAVGGAVLTFGMFLTFSRGALITWCILLACLAVTRQVRASFILTTLAILVIMTSIYWPLVSSRAPTNPSTKQFTEQLSMSERREQLTQFHELFKTRWPFGVGLGQYTVDGRQPIHNITLMILAEVGILGLVLWLALILQPLLRLKHRLLHHPASYLLLAILLLGMFDHYWWTSPSFSLLWCLMIGWLYQKPA